jgi:hypothetical protein
VINQENVTVDAIIPLKERVVVHLKYNSQIGEEIDEFLTFSPASKDISTDNLPEELE